VMEKRPNLAGVQTRLVDMVESFEKRKDAQVWREVELFSTERITIMTRSWAGTRK